MRHARQRSTLSSKYQQGGVSRDCSPTRLRATRHGGRLASATSSHTHTRTSGVGLTAVSPERSALSCGAGLKIYDLRFTKHRTWPTVTEPRRVSIMAETNTHLATDTARSPPDAFDARWAALRHTRRVRAADSIPKAHGYRKHLRGFGQCNVE